MSKVNCYGCNVEKDLSVEEVSPFHDEDGLFNGPIAPLLVLDVQGPPLVPNDPNNYCEFRQTRVCHVCFHALQPDMWISESCWAAINPHVPYERLPLFDSKLMFDPSQLKSL